MKLDFFQKLNVSFECHSGIVQQFVPLLELWLTIDRKTSLLLCNLAVPQLY